MQFYISVCQNHLSYMHMKFISWSPVAYVIHMLTFVEGVPLQDRRANDPQTWFGVGQMLGHVRETLKVSCL